MIRIISGKLCVVLWCLGHWWIIFNECMDWLSEGDPWSWPSLQNFAPLSLLFVNWRIQNSDSHISRRAVIPPNYPLIKSCCHLGIVPFCLSRTHCGPPSDGESNPFWNCVWQAVGEAVCGSYPHLRPSVSSIHCFFLVSASSFVSCFSSAP